MYCRQELLCPEITMATVRTALSGSAREWSGSDTVEQAADHRAIALASSGCPRKRHCRRPLRRLRLKHVPGKSMSAHRPDNGTTKGNLISLHSQKIADHE